MTDRLKDIATLCALVALLIAAASLALNAAETAIVCAGPEGSPVSYPDYRDWRLLDGGAVSVTDRDGGLHIHPAHANCHVAPLTATR